MGWNNLRLKTMGCGWLPQKMNWFVSPKKKVLESRNYSTCVVVKSTAKVIINIIFNFICDCSKLTIADKLQAKDNLSKSWNISTKTLFRVLHSGNILNHLRELSCNFSHSFQENSGILLVRASTTSGRSGWGLAEKCRRFSTYITNLHIYMHFLVLFSYLGIIL